MKPQFYLACAAAALLTVATPAFAQTTLETDELIVIGTRFKTPLDQVGRSVTVITQEELEIRQPRFVYDAIAAAPGVQLIRQGSFGALSTVSLRGLPSKQTLVVQDGIVVNDPSTFDNGFNFANFSTSDVARIEVLRGAQSTLYGSNAIGGVINIITQDGRDGFGGDAFAEGGSFATFSGGLNVYGGSARTSGRLSVAGVRSDGFSSADESNGNTEDDGYRNITVSSKGRFAPTDALTLEGVVRFQDNAFDFDGFAFPAGPVDGEERGESQEVTAAAILTHTLFDERLENRAIVSYSRTDREDRGAGAVITFAGLGERFSYEYQGTLEASEALSVIAGAEYDVQKSTVDVGFGGNQNIETASGFGLVQLEPVSYLTVNAGVRHDASTDFDNETTFSVSAAFVVPGMGAIFRGGYAEGYRAPTAGELSFNNTLRPEFSESWDIGVEYPLFDGRASIGATYFDAQISDLIAFDLATFNFLNIQTFSSQGVELSARAQITDALSFNGAYTHVDAVNLSTTIAAGNQPDNRFHAELAYTPSEKWRVSAGVSYNGRELDGATTLDSFTLVSLRGAYQVNDTFGLFARVENVTDRDYQDDLGYGAAPISAYGGVRAVF